MSIRKRNEYLDGDDSEEELNNGSASETEDGRGAIANKRRKIDQNADSDSEASFAGVDDAEDEKPTKPAPKDSRFDLSNFHDPDEDEEPTAQPASPPSNHKTKPSKSKALKQVEAAAKVSRKSGVVYISRVPPFMKPHTLKHFLEPHAPKGIHRIFLTPEDHIQHQKRVKNGGNKKKSFTDGWVEFNSKREGKIAAETLNGGIIGGKKGGFYHDDLWNMKYLRGFKWDHLNEQIANENAEREARMKAEIWKTRKENKAFVEDLERGKMLETMERKKRARLEREGGKAEEEDVGDGMPRREFKQRKVRTAGEKERAEKPFAEAASVRSKIF